MVLGKEILNSMSVALANGGTVVQIHISQRQSGALEWSRHTHNERGNYIDGFQRASRPNWERKERAKYDTTFLTGTTGILGTSVAVS